MNKYTAQRLGEISEGSGFLVSETTTAQDVREYFTLENFEIMFPDTEHDAEQIKADGEYIIANDPVLKAEVAK